MKKTIPLTVASLLCLLAGCSKHSQNSASLVPFTPDPQQALSSPPAPPVPAPAGWSAADIPAGSVQFNAQLSTALTIHAELADAQLQVEPQIPSLA